MIPLLVGSLLAVVALAYVLLPILRTESGGARPLVQTSPTLVGGTDEGSSAIEALREVEFDRATGKLSEPETPAERRVVEHFVPGTEPAPLRVDARRLLRVGALLGF